jgi:ParE toxin of type II toxin-antitoxin system, parDE
MKLSISIVPKAEEDILESIDWYNQEKSNLGFEFYDQLTEAIGTIEQSPKLFAVRFKTVRAAPLKRFPFLIYYKILESENRVIILGALHTSRNPKTILKRN